MFNSTIYIEASYYELPSSIDATYSTGLDKRAVLLTQSSRLRKNVITADQSNSLAIDLLLKYSDPFDSATRYLVYGGPNNVPLGSLFFWYIQNQTFDSSPYNQITIVQFKSYVESTVIINVPENTAKYKSADGTVSRHRTMKPQVNANYTWDVVLDARSGSTALTIWTRDLYPSFLAGIAFDNDNDSTVYLDAGAPTNNDIYRIATYKDYQTASYNSTFFSGNGNYLRWDLFDNTTDYGRVDSGYYFTFEFGSTDKLNLGMPIMIALAIRLLSNFA
ncbi:hypothetical protein WR25_16005 [Diploscapter pachys]|uniref:Uncharacterized protein n=1 Tax=Diploscapter pachys TaxID=2018661 RepID=A0A2A2KXP4_9BILA|nr:hypothetical protein WR25_16005 [Diploscapter pachys]